MGRNKNKTGWYIWSAPRHWMLEWRIDGRVLVVIEWNKWLGCVNGQTRNEKGEMEWIIKDDSGRPDVTYSTLKGVITVPGLKDDSGCDVADSLLNLYNRYHGVAIVE